MLSDIEIARSVRMKDIASVADGLGIRPEDVEPYGRHKAKIALGAGGREDGRLVLVTAVNPTPAGEGKTTTTIGLSMALNRIGAKAVAAIREPSLGPVFGMKGGAAGGGYSQVLPMEDINLHFTGDLHAVTAANNLLAAMVDNHMQQGNALAIDPRRVVWKRCVDMNDKALRDVIVGLGGKANGMPREEGFTITAASEVMAVLCLAQGLEDLKGRLARMIVGHGYDDGPITAGDLRAQGALALLLKDAIKPNLVQTTEGTPALVHGGPFANIAHGCSSVAATKMGLRLADYVVTEAGFGADLGAEKFLGIKCRTSGLAPKAAVLVTTLRALRYNGGAAKGEFGSPCMDALAKGVCNLEKHLENMAMFGVPTCVAINRYGTDSPEELRLVSEACARLGVRAVESEAYARGGAGAEGLAREIVRLCGEGSGGALRFPYAMDDAIAEKIRKVATAVYGADGVELSPAAAKGVKAIEAMGAGGLPVCMAKTQFSFTDDPTVLGRPKGFTIKVRDVRLYAGAGFVTAYAGEVLTMPGLPKVPSAEGMDVYEDGGIVGLS